MKNYKIGHFIGTLGVGGAETMVINFSKHLVDSGHNNTCVIGFDKSWISEKCKELGIEFISIPYDMEYWWNHVRALPIYTYYLRKLLKKHKIDLLHSHLYKATIENALACYTLGIPHVSTSHDSFTVAEKRSRKKWLSIANALGTQLVAVSDSIREVYGLSDMLVIPNGYSPTIIPKYEGLKGRSALGIPNGDTVITIVARLIPLKRIDYLIEAINVMVYVKNMKSIKLLIVGDGPEYINLDNKVKALGLDEYVMLLGQREDVPNLLALSDLFVLPSTTEGLSCAIIEAMFAGLPIVATNVGGNKDLVIDEHNGRLIPLSEDVMVLADAICSIVADSVEWETFLGRNSFYMANQKFTMDKMASAYLNLYSKMLEVAP